MSYEPKNPNGQATMANSQPLVIASDQSPIPFTEKIGEVILLDFNPVANATNVVLANANKYNWIIVKVANGNTPGSFNLSLSTREAIQIQTANVRLPYYILCENLLQTSAILSLSDIKTTGTYSGILSIERITYLAFPNFLYEQIYYTLTGSALQVITFFGTNSNLAELLGQKVSLNPTGQQLMSASTSVALAPDQTQIPVYLDGKVEELNSTNVPLNTLDTFTGVFVDVLKYASVTVAAKTDQDSILYVDFSPDGVNLDSTLSYSISSNINEVHRITITRKYARIRLYNSSASNQTFLRLQTILGYQQTLTSSLNSTVQQDADTIVTRTIESQIDIASGKYVGFSIVNKAGFNPQISIGTVPEDITDNGGVYAGFPLTSGETITVLSSNVNDTSAGSGARTLRITGLDDNYNIQTEDFILNGTTPVVGIKIFTRVHTGRVLTSGTSNDTYNAGNITVRHTTTAANVFLFIRIGTNQSYSSGYTIPTGYTGYVRNINCKIGSGSSTTSAIDFSIWTQSALKTTSKILRRPNSTYFGYTVTDLIYGGIVFTEKTDIILQVTLCSQNNTFVQGGYDLLLVKN